MKLPKNKIFNSRSVVIFAITIAAFACLIVKPYQVKAQTTTFLRVAPDRQEIAVNPGEKTNVVVKFLNAEPAPQTGLLKVADFIVDNNEGIPNFLEGPTQLSSRYAAASWVELPYDRMVIGANDQVIVQAKINVPADAQPGGRYFAIFFEPSSEVSGVSTNARVKEEQAVTPRIAALVYLRVNGPVKEDALISRFEAPRFSEYGPLPVSTEILNRGNYHIHPTGSITVTNMFGKVVDQQKIDEANIFPDASRVFNNSLGEKWMIGKFRIELQAAYGDSGKALDAVIFAWVFPWKVASVILLGIIILLLIIFVVFKNLRQHEEQLEEKIEELEEKLEDTSDGKTGTAKK